MFFVSLVRKAIFRFVQFFGKTSAKGSKGKALIVVDMSVEQVANLHYRKDLVIENIKALAETDLWAAKIDAKLWLYSNTESTLSLIFPSWGVSMGVPGSEGASLIPQLDDLGLEFIEKKHYSSFVDSRLLARLKEAKVDEVYVTGINTDFCVFATALDAQARGRFATFVVEDAASSVTGKGGHEEGIRRTVAHLGKTSVVSTKDIIKLENV